MAIQSKAKNTLPAIPKVNVSDPQLQRFCDTVTQLMAIHTGRIGNGLDRAVTAREMIESGFARVKKAGQATGSGSTKLVPQAQDPLIPVEKPTKPKGFKVISGTTAIMLIFDNVDFKGAGNTIVYRASSDDFSKAKVLIETPMSVYSDIPDDDHPYWYWIRHTNVNGDQGPLSSAAGVKGQAGLLTTDKNGDKMLANDLVAFAIYATELTAVKVKGGYLDFAGGRFKVDESGNAKASSLTIAAGGYSRSETYTSGKQGWAIYGNGNVEFNNGTFRGTVYAENGVFKGTVYAEHIVGDIVTSISIDHADVKVGRSYTVFDSVKVVNARPYPRTLIISFSLNPRVDVTSENEHAGHGLIEGKARITGDFGTIESHTIKESLGPIAEGSQSASTESNYVIMLPISVPANKAGTMTIEAIVTNERGNSRTLTEMYVKGLGGTTWTAQLYRDGGDLSA